MRVLLKPNRGYDGKSGSAKSQKERTSRRLLLKRSRFATVTYFFGSRHFCKYWSLSLSALPAPNDLFPPSVDWKHSCWWEKATWLAWPCYKHTGTSLAMTFVSVSFRHGLAWIDIFILLFAIKLRCQSTFACPIIWSIWRKGMNVCSWRTSTMICIIRNLRVL